MSQAQNIASPALQEHTLGIEPTQQPLSESSAEPSSSSRGFQEQIPEITALISNGGVVGDELGEGEQDETLGTFRKPIICCPQDLTIFLVESSSPESAHVRKEEEDGGTFDVEATSSGAQQTSEQLIQQRIDAAIAENNAQWETTFEQQNLEHEQILEERDLEHASTVDFWKTRFNAVSADMDKVQKTCAEEKRKCSLQMRLRKGLILLLGHQRREERRETQRVLNDKDAVISFLDTQLYQRAQDVVNAGTDVVKMDIHLTAFKAQYEDMLNVANNTFTELSGKVEEILKIKDSTIQDLERRYDNSIAQYSHLNDLYKHEQNRRATEEREAQYLRGLCQKQQEQIESLQKQSALSRPAEDKALSRGGADVNPEGSFTSRIPRTRTTSNRKSNTIRPPSSTKQHRSMMPPPSSNFDFGGMSENGSDRGPPPGLGLGAFGQELPTSTWGSSASANENRAAQEPPPGLGFGSAEGNADPTPGRKSRFADLFEESPI